MVKKKAKKAIKKPVKAKKAKKLACRACGLVVSVDTDCGCLDAHELICCGETMKVKK
jgi:hypothetical protein